MNGLSGVSSLMQRPLLRMGAARHKSDNVPNPTTGRVGADELPPGPPITRQRGVRVQDPFRTADLPTATEANETNVFNAVNTLFAPEAADPSRIHIEKETRSTHGKRQLGVNITYYYNHASFVHQQSPTDKDHTLYHAYTRLSQLAAEGRTINKHVEPTGVVVDGIPVRLISGHYLAPNQVVLGGGEIGTLADGERPPGPPIRQGRKTTP